VSSGDVPNDRSTVQNPAAEVSCTVAVANEQGLHARPVMRFVDLANRFQARVIVQREDRLVDGKNPMEMMLLEAVKGTSLEIRAQGKDAQEAVEALSKLVRSGFGEC
jgi:phosphocarrier protein HPr